MCMCIVKTEILKTHYLYIRHYPTKNIISGKASEASNKQRQRASIKLRGLGGDLSPLRKIFSSKEHLDWLKIDLNATMITLACWSD